MNRTIKLPWGTASKIRKVLFQLDRSGVQGAAYWSRAIRRRMDSRDVRTVGNLLLHASGVRSLPMRQRKAARTWAARLGA